MSTPTNQLSFTMPPNACNAHLHIIDPAFPNDGHAAAQIGTVDAYRQLARDLNLPRAVFVQAKPFALDNTCLLDAIARFGKENARGIAVVDHTVTNRELEILHEGGVRGLRFSVWNPNNAVITMEDCLPLSQRIKEFGWNIQLHMSAAQIASYADLISSLECKVVIDHMGRLDPKLGTSDPAYQVICRMIDRGNTWIKLSGPYLNTCQGEPWDDATRTAQVIVQFAPQRVVWGSDFPHVTEKKKPEELTLVEMIPLWLPTEQARKLVMSENPQKLYGF